MYHHLFRRRRQADQNYQPLAPLIFNPVRRACRRPDDMSRTHFSYFFADCKDSPAFKHIIKFILIGVLMG